MQLADLTPEKINRIEAGPECDALVAEALGMPANIAEFRAKTTCTLPPYSTSWDAAMGAATTAGLWDDDCVVSFESCGEFWHVRQFIFRPAGGEFDIESHTVTEAPTGPLAVCRAILRAAIKEKAEVPA